MIIYLLPPGALSQKYVKSDTTHLVGLFIDTSKLTKAAPESTVTVGGGEKQIESTLQQKINLILKGDSREPKAGAKAENEKQGGTDTNVQADLIASIMPNPGLTAFFNNQNAQNFISQPK